MPKQNSHSSFGWPWCPHFHSSTAAVATETTQLLARKLHQARKLHRASCPGKLVHQLSQGWEPCDMVCLCCHALPWVHGTAVLQFRRGFPTPSSTSSEVATQTLIETSLHISCSIFEKHVPLALFLSIMYLSCFFLCSCFIPLLVARKFSQAHAIQCLIHNHHHPGRPLPQVKLQIQMVFGSQSPVGR